MARGYGFMAVACWCALTTAASAQYPQQGGQAPQNLPSSEYFTALNGGLPPVPAATPRLAPSSPWAVPVAGQGSFESQPRVASSFQQGPPVPPQPLSGSPDMAPNAANYSLVPNAGGQAPMGGGCNDGALIPDQVAYSTSFGGWLGSRFNGYGVPVYGGLNQFNRCCPVHAPCGSGGCGTWGSGIGSAAPAGSAFAGAIAGSGDCNGGCATGAWYGNAAALFLWRTGGNRTWLTYNENNNADQLLNTQMANNNGYYGGQITIGRYLGCNHAVEGTYWGVATSQSSVSVTDPNNKLGTPLDEGGAALGGAPFGPPSPPNFAPFDGSHQQEIIRRDNFQNGEINFLTFPVAYNPTSRFRVALLSGVRYFRFQDSLIYGGAAFGTNFGDNGGASEAFLNVRTTNNLLGTQIGARMSYFVTPRFALFATPKMGIYSNMMGVRASLYSGDGREGFNVSNTSTGFAAMGEIDLGGQYYITPRCAVFAAYRLIGVTGVATADTQIPPYLVDTAGFTQLNHADSLILQGVLTGLSWNY